MRSSDLENYPRYKVGNALVFNADMVDIGAAMSNRLANECGCVLMDPPFNYMAGQIEANSYKDVGYRVALEYFTKIALKCLKPYGNFISVNYPQNNFIVNSIAEKKKNIELMDMIVVKKNSMNGKPGYLPRGYVTMYVYTKTEQSQGKESAVCRNISNDTCFKQNKAVYDTSSELSDIWGTGNNKDDVAFKPGKCGVNEAMPLRYVKRLLNLYAGQGPVFDMFAGSGNVSEVCNNMNLESIAVEIDKKRYNAIKTRLTHSGKVATKGDKYASCNYSQA